MIKYTAEKTKWKTTPRQKSMSSYSTYLEVSFLPSLGTLYAFVRDLRTPLQQSTRLEYEHSNLQTSLVFPEVKPSPHNHCHNSSCIWHLFPGRHFTTGRITISLTTQGTGIESRTLHVTRCSPVGALPVAGSGRHSTLSCTKEVTPLRTSDASTASWQTRGSLLASSSPSMPSTSRWAPRGRLTTSTVVYRVYNFTLQHAKGGKKKLVGCKAAEIQTSKTARDRKHLWSLRY